MELVFTKKTDLNRALLKALRMSLVDKDDAVLDYPGKHYDHISPADYSLFGSIGQEPNPDFDGPQPPNAMGMVILVTPDASETVSCMISGQFDIAYRYIPDITVMLDSLNRDVHGVKESQPVVTSYRRLTVQFESLPLTFKLPKDNNQWVIPPTINPLQMALTDLEE